MPSHESRVDYLRTAVNTLYGLSLSAADPAIRPMFTIGLFLIEEVISIRKSLIGLPVADYFKKLD